MFEHRDYYEGDNLILQQLLEAGTIDAEELYPLLVASPEQSRKSVTTTVVGQDEDGEDIHVENKIILKACDHQCGAILESVANQVGLPFTKFTHSEARAHVRTSPDYNQE